MRPDPRFLGQFRVRESETALRFPQDVRKTVFQRYHGRFNSVRRARAIFSNASATPVREKQLLVSRSIEVMVTMLLMPQGTMLIERREITCDVQSESVHGNPMPHPYADRSNLSILNPDTGQSRFAAQPR